MASENENEQPAKLYLDSMELDVAERFNPATCVVEKEPGPRVRWSFFRVPGPVPEGYEARTLTYYVKSRS